MKPGWILSGLYFFVGTVFYLENLSPLVILTHMGKNLDFPAYLNMQNSHKSGSLALNQNGLGLAKRNNFDASTLGNADASGFGNSYSRSIRFFPGLMG